MASQWGYDRHNVRKPATQVHRKRKKKTETMGHYLISMTKSTGYSYGYIHVAREYGHGYGYSVWMGVEYGHGYGYSVWMGVLPWFGFVTTPWAPPGAARLYCRPRKQQAAATTFAGREGTRKRRPTTAPAAAGRSRGKQELRSR